MKGKYLLFQLVIVLNTFAAAATCDVALDSSSSVAQVVKLATDGLNATRSLKDGEERLYSPGGLRFICRSLFVGRSYEGKTTYTLFLDRLQQAAKKSKFTIDNPKKYLFDNSDRLVCTSTVSTSLRKEMSIFKFSIDIGRFEFIREALLLKDASGNEYCNPKMDLTKADLIDGKKETLLDFLNKTINDPGVDAIHDMWDLKRLRGQVRNCMRK